MFCFFQSKFGNIALRKRRSVQDLTDAINKFLNSDDGASSNLDAETFLRHLSYDVSLLATGLDYLSQFHQKYIQRRLQITSD